MNISLVARYCLNLTNSMPRRRGQAVGIYPHLIKKLKLNRFVFICTHQPATNGKQS